ncbi:MAG: 30S ribosomal protein S20 [Dehalococcoidia bacterium]|nr:30S ribosomal protein S20 [Dehalococcoidia bacterium]MDD5647859.1 30S ribosomal protein S20 [Dehalococcoidia bacterium]
MPKTKTAEKSARSAERKAERNKAIRSGTKSKVTRAEKLIATKKGAESGAAVTEAISSLDRAAKRKVIHANTAARKKSRLMKKLNASQKK